VVFAFAPPLVLTTEVEVAVRPLVGPGRVGERVPARALLGDLLETGTCAWGR